MGIVKLIIKIDGIVQETTDNVSVDQQVNFEIKGMSNDLAHAIASAMMAEPILVSPIIEGVKNYLEHKDHATLEETDGHKKLTKKKEKVIN